nr:MAG: hypothetical protein ADFBMEEK_00042 [Peromyscus leucopus gammaherpesvirus]
METVIQTLIGTQQKGSTDNIKYVPAYTQPIYPRLMLELNKKGDIYLATNTPLFICNDGSVNVSDLQAHVKSRILSPYFEGFVFSSILDNEDTVDKLDIYPHVFLSRIHILKSADIYLMELCAILSMVENLEKPTRAAMFSMLNRARLVYSRSPSKDSAYILNGIEYLISTLLWYYELTPVPPGNLPEPLMMFKLHKCLNESSEDTRGLLKPIYLEPWKMSLEDGRTYNSPTKGSFSLFHNDTLLTRHLKSPEILNCIRYISTMFSANTTIFS